MSVKMVWPPCTFCARAVNFQGHISIPIVDKYMKLFMMCELIHVKTGVLLSKENKRDDL